MKREVLSAVKTTALVRAGYYPATAQVLADVLVPPLDSGLGVNAVIARIWN